MMMMVLVLVFISIYLCYVILEEVDLIRTTDRGWPFLFLFLFDNTPPSIAHQTNSNFTSLPCLFIIIFLFYFISSKYSICNWMIRMLLDYHAPCMHSHNQNKPINYTQISSTFICSFISSSITSNAN